MNEPRIDGVLETILYGDDLLAMRSFYSGAIGLEEVAFESGRHVFFRCGAGMLLIFDPRSTRVDEVRVGGALIPRHGAVGAGHLAFAVASDEIEAWRERLGSHDVEIESEIAWYAERPAVRSLYFRDPVGNSIEISCRGLWFPKE